MADNKVYVLRFPRPIEGNFAAVDWVNGIGSTSDVSDRKRLMEQLGAEDITDEFEAKKKAEAEKKALETADLEVQKEAQKKAEEEKKIVEIVERAVREGTLKISAKVIK